MNPFDIRSAPQFDMGSEVRAATGAFYPKTPDDLSQPDLTQPDLSQPNLSQPCLQHAHNRAFEALIEMMVELMDPFGGKWSYNTLLAAVHKADEQLQEKQAAVDDECVRCR